MPRLSVRLFGRLSVHCDDEAVRGFNAWKVQELFCHLLLHRDRPHPREGLASVLWGDTPTSQSKKYLRQCLWQLQAALNTHAAPAERRALRVEPDWVQLNGASDLQVDVARCLYERERLQNMYLAMLDKLMVCCELHPL